MATPAPDQAALMDFAALLKAFRVTREEAAQVAQQLQERLQACQALESGLTTTLPQALQQASASLQQAEAQTLAELADAMQHAHAPLMHQWQQVVAHAVQVQRWLPWKVGLLLVGATLLVNVTGTYVWGRQQAAALQASQGMQRLAQRLDQHVAGTLYAQLSKAQQRELDALYKEAGFMPVGARRP
jgi:hypothetical protein